MRRVLCLWFPSWPVQWRTVGLPVGRRPPLVVHAAVGGKDVVVARSRSARSRGVRVGMRLADAEALWPKPGTVRVEPADPITDRAKLREVAAVCRQFTPTVAVDPAESPDALLLDATGCGWGRGGEEQFAADVVTAVRRRGYWAAAAAADTLGAAWAVARYGTRRRLLTSDPRGRVVIVPRGGHGAALRPLPVECLRLTPRVVEVLHELSVRRVEQLLALSRDQLPARFGTEILRCIDRALGELPEGFRAEPAEEPLEARWSFESPVADAAVILAVIDELLGRLLREVRGRDVGFQRLLWWLQVGGHGQVCQPVELLRPTRSQTDLRELIRLQLDRLRLPGEATEVAVRAAVAPLTYRQGDLFGGRVGPHRPAAVTDLIERLSSRLGHAAVLRPRLVPDGLPELASHLDPWVAVAGEKRADSRTPVRLTRPPCLNDRPEPVLAMTADPGGPPAWLKWGDREYAIERAWGPERIETGWWRGADVRRDYYLVETTAGERFWLFRDLTAGGWYLHGLYA